MSEQVMFRTADQVAADLAAEVYEAFFVPAILDYWTPVFLERVAPQPGEAVLDVACGTGVVARAAARQVGPDGRVVGLDMNPEMLAVAWEMGGAEIGWNEGLAENLPFPDQAFDLVTCQHGLAFFQNRAQAVREMRRVLRPHGRVGVIVWQPLDRNPFYQRILSAIATVYDFPLSGLSTAFSFGSPWALASLLAGAGFKAVEVEPVRQEVQFNRIERFIELTIRASAAVVPGFAQLDGRVHEVLAVEVTREVAGYMRGFMQGGRLRFPMYGNIGVGICGAV